MRLGSVFHAWMVAVTAVTTFVTTFQTQVVTKICAYTRAKPLLSPLSPLLCRNYSEVCVSVQVRCPTILFFRAIIL